MSAKISDNVESTDRLSIRILGRISTSGSEVQFDDPVQGTKVIGTFSGGSGTAALVVVFNTNATTARVQAVLQALAYRDISANPSSKARTLSVYISVGDGGTSATSTKTINVEPVNDKPVLGGISGSVGYVHNAAAIVLAGSATVTDVGQRRLRGGGCACGSMRPIASNRLTIAGASSSVATM